MYDCMLGTWGQARQPKKKTIPITTTCTCNELTMAISIQKHIAAHCNSAASTPPYVIRCGNTNCSVEQHVFGVFHLLFRLYFRCGHYSQLYRRPLGQYVVSYAHKAWVASGIMSNLIWETLSKKKVQRRSPLRQSKLLRKKMTLFKFSFEKVVYTLGMFNKES